MNFKITHNWLLDYIDTDATPEEIQKYLSLSAVSVETIEKVKNDYVYDIEVTSNRIDAASVFGFALECVAVLPRYGNKATLKENPLQKSFESILTPRAGKKIQIDIKDGDIITRLAAVVLSDVKVEKSPDIIRERLEACGERSISNVVDISNYIRIALGQPVHIFDYDSITGSKMCIEKSSEGDKVVLIDGKELSLPGNDIIVRDGSGRIIDLVGLMGGQNTEVTDTTQNILLFVPVPDKTLVRKTSMTTGHRTAAISYFEKGLDEERVEPTLVYGIELLQQYTGAKIASDIQDIYPYPLEEKIVAVEMKYLERLMNTDLEEKNVIDMLTPLGFVVSEAVSGKLSVQVPSYRLRDIDNQTDILEEVARVYGYHNIKSEIQHTDPVYQPIDMFNLLGAKERIRDFLSSVGFYEQYTYSMISKSDLENFGVLPKNHLKLTNSISQDIEYMRSSLVPSLLKVIADNQGKKDMLHFFEIARTYEKREGELPQEEETVCIVSHADFSIMKGVLENLIDLLHVEGASFALSSDVRYLGSQTKLEAKGTTLATLGVLKDTYRLAFNIKNGVTIIEIRLRELIKHINRSPKYVKPNPFAHIKFDLTYTSSPDKVYGEIETKAHKLSGLLQSIELLSTFENQVTLRFTFAAKDKNITEAEAVIEFEKIKAILS